MDERHGRQMRVGASERGSDRVSMSRLDEADIDGRAREVRAKMMGINFVKSFKRLFSAAPEERPRCSSLRFSRRWLRRPLLDPVLTRPSTAAQREAATTLMGGVRRINYGLHLSRLLRPLPFEPQPVVGGMALRCRLRLHRTGTLALFYVASPSFSPAAVSTSLRST